MKKSLLIILLLSFTLFSPSISYALGCQSPYVEYQGECVDPIPACKNPPANFMPTTCIDKIENGEYIERYNFQCLDGYIRSGKECIKECVSPFVPYEGKCVDPIPPCQNPPANIMPSSCIDKIVDGKRIERYNFSCMEGYKKVEKECVYVGTPLNCQLPYVEYQGKCVDPIPPCKNPPLNVMPSTCIDKIENGQYIERYKFQCRENYVRSGNICVSKSNYQPTQTGTATIPPAGFEDEVIVNLDAYKNPFPDTNSSYLEGKAAAELYRRGVIGGYPDGEFKGARFVNRAEAAKFLLLAKLGTVSELQNTGRFPDVKEGEWYVKFVIKAANLGIIEGHPDGNFRPQNTVNTAEFLKMLTKTFGLKEGLSYTYSDVNSTDWFARYAGVAQKYDIFPSRSMKLEPGRNMTRDEVAVAIYQYLRNR